MIGRAAVATLLLGATPCVADESPVPGVLQQFALSGTWAIDCARPESPANEYSIYAVSSTGDATLTYARGEPYRDVTYAIRTARLVAEQRLALQVLRLPEKIPVELVLRKDGDSIQVWSSHTPDGRMLVIDGVIIGNGAPSPRFKHCSK